MTLIISTKVQIEDRPKGLLLATNRDSYSHASFGHNAQGFSTALGMFGGLLNELALTDDEKRNFLRRCLQATAPLP